MPKVLIGEFKHGIIISLTGDLIIRLHALYFNAIYSLCFYTEKSFN